MKMKVSEMGQKLFDCIRPYAEKNMERIVASDARPIVIWEDRQVQTVNQEDILANYQLLRDYLLLVGSNSPVPDLIHHQACMILISVTYNLHSHVYGRRGFRGLIRDWASQEATRLKCMGAYLMHLTQKNTSSRDQRIQCLKTIIIKMHEKSGRPLKKRSKSSQSVSSQASGPETEHAAVQDAYSGESHQEAVLVTPKMKADLEEVRATEVKLLKSPEEELWPSVKKVLDFRDELDAVVEVAQSSKKTKLAATLGFEEDVPAHELVTDVVASMKRSPLVKKVLELPEFMKNPQQQKDQGSTSSNLLDKQKLLRDQLKEDKKNEEMEKDERKRKRQEEKEQKALQPKRPRGRPRKNDPQKDESKKDESHKEDPKEDDTKKDDTKVESKGKGKRTHAEPMCKKKAKSAKVEKPVQAQSSGSSKGSRLPEKPGKSSPQHGGGDGYQSSDARTARAMDALKELHGVMKKVPGFSMPDLKSFSNKSYTIDSGAGPMHPTIGVVLYSRNYHVVRCGPDGWPKVASDFGLEERTKRITIPWGEDPKEAFCVAKAIAGWS